MTQELDPKELRKVAEAATPGPWEAKQTPIHTPSGEGGDYYVACPSGIDVASMVGSSYEQEEPDALHIATFDPPTVLALIERVQAAEAKLERVREVCESSAFDCSTREWGNLEAVCTDDVLTALDGEPNE